MSRKECIRGVLGDDDVDEDFIDAALSDLEAKRGQRRQGGLFSDESAASRTDAEKAAKDAEIAALIERRNAMLNVLARRNAMSDIGTFGDDYRGLVALLAGSNKRIKGARVSVDALYRAREAKYLGGLRADLKKAGVLKFMQPRRFGFGKGPLDDAVAIELWELRDGGKPGSTGSKEAQIIAGIVNKWQEVSRLDQNRYGAFIRKLPGRIVAQSHDMMRIRDAGMDAWIKEVLPRIDVERTFPGISGPQATMLAMRGVYDELSTGVFHQASTPKDMLGFKGPANLAKKISQSRVLHFKTAQDWIAYNDKFGAGSLFEAVAQGLQHAARSTALMERLGTNPQAMFERLQSDLVKKNLGDTAQVDRLRSPWLDSLMAVADGRADAPGSVHLASIASGARALQSMSKLGGAVLSSIPDVATAASELQFQGRTFLGGVAEQLNGFFAGMPEGDRREAADLIGVGVDNFLGAVHGRFAGSENFSRTSGKLLNVFFELNLQNWWTYSNERALSSTMARDLYRHKELAFGALPERLRQALSLYDIGPVEWRLMAKYGSREIEGVGYLIPDGIREAPDDAVASLIEGAMTKAAINRAKDRVENSFRAYFLDRTAVGVLKGGFREKVNATFGTRPGTAMGEAARSVMQFKQYPIAFVQKIIGRYTQADQFIDIPKSIFKVRGSDAYQLAGLVVSLTALGYVAMALKDIAKGREPRDPARLDTMMAAMTQGGGLGIYGDFLLMKAGRFGDSPLETVAGPLAGTASNATELVLAVRDYALGKSDELPDNQAFNFFKANTPFLNLFYARAALDYMILYRMQEAMSPGSLRRLERRLKTDQGQEFILPPSEVVN